MQMTTEPMTVRVSPPVESTGSVDVEEVEAALHPRDWRVGEMGRVQVFLLLSRRGLVEAPGTRIELVAPAMAWFTGHRPRRVRLEAGARGYRLSASNDAVTAAMSNLPGAAHLRTPSGETSIWSDQVLAPYAGEIAQSCRALAREIREPTMTSTGLLAAHLGVICLHAGRLAGLDRHDVKIPPERATSIAQRFLHLVDLHLRDGWTVSRYAGALGVAPDRLHGVCVRSLGAPPGAVLRERLMREAVLLLTKTDLAAEQVGFSLGFRDPAYFNRVFRRHLGLPPGRFRKERPMDDAEPRPGSYAAWP